jgi:hypothetical protein
MFASACAARLSVPNGRMDMTHLLKRAWLRNQLRQRPQL